MSNHVSKNMKELLQKMVRNGFGVEYTGKCVKISPPTGIVASMYTAHFGEKGFHPVRRYVKNVCKIILK